MSYIELAPTDGTGAADWSLSLWLEEQTGQAIVYIDTL